MADANTRVGIIIEAENKASGTIEDVGDKLNGLNKNVASFRTAFASMALAGTAAFAGLSYGLVSIAKAGAELEQTNVAFKVMLGSAEKANKMVSDLNDLAMKTPFELKDIRSSAKSLLAFGVSGEELIGTLKTLGDISAGVGTERLPQLTLAFGQVRGAGKLMGSELRQFTEAGVPLLEELSKVTGHTVKEMAGNIGNMGITFDDVNKALGNLTSKGGRFFNLMEEQSKTLGGSYSNLKDAITKAMSQIGLAFTPVLTPMIQKITEVVGKVSEWAQAHPYLVGGILLFVTAVAGLTAAIGVLGLAFMGMAAAGAALVPVLAAIGITVGGAAAALLTTAGIIVGVIAGIGLLIAAGVYLYTHWDEVKARTIDAWEKIKVFLAEAWENIKAVAAAVWEGIKVFFSAFWDAMAVIFKFAVALLAGIVLGGFGLMGIDLVQVWENIKTVAGMFWDFMKQMFDSSITFVKGLWIIGWGFLRDVVSPIIETIKGFVNTMWKVIKAVFETLQPVLGPIWTAFWEQAKNFVVQIWDVIKAIVQSSVNWIIDKINWVIGQVNSVAQAGGDTLGFSAPQIPMIPRLANGGIAIGRTIAEVGEGSQPEAIIPLDRLDEMMGGRGSRQSPTIIVNVNGGNYLDEYAAEKFGDILLSKLQMQYRGA